MGGLEKVFEIGKVFRNEGIDAEHLQDYQHMEFYWAYADMGKCMKLVEKMYKEVITHTAASDAMSAIEGVEYNLVTEHEGKKISWQEKWPVLDYFKEFKKATGIGMEADLSVEALRAKADELGIGYEKNYGKGRMIDTIFEERLENSDNPTLISYRPSDLRSFTLAKADPASPNKVLRFQVIAGGSELGNGFSELNDPLEQRKRFRDQMMLREAGDEEAQMIDEDFVEALEYGMPPAVGFGMSERLFAFIMNKSVRETVIFPPMKEK